MHRASGIFCEWESPASFNVFQPWLRAAAIYNFVWGLITLIFPAAFFSLVGLPQPNYLVLWRVVGMFVLVYAPGYWWAARDPFRFRHLILIGLMGKIFGPLGYLWFAAAGELPLEFGWTIATNDLVWWPAFFLCLA